MIRWCTVPEIRCVTDVIVISYFGLFFALLQKIKILKKWKKTFGVIIILYMCTKNYDQMMTYGSWDIVHDGCDYFSFWAIFCPFISLTAQKIKIKRKMKKNKKKHLKISSFYICLPKIVIRCTVPGIWCLTDVIVISHLGLFFDLLTAQKIKILKKYKKHMDVPKIMVRWCMVPEIWCATDERMDRRTDGQTDEQTDGQTEKVTYRGGCPN